MVSTSRSRVYDASPALPLMSASAPAMARTARAIARADADIKGAASDASYTLERLVLTVTGLREPR